MTPFRFLLALGLVTALASIAPAAEGAKVYESDKCPVIGGKGTRTCWVCEKDNGSLSYHDTKSAADKTCGSAGIVREDCWTGSEWAPCDEIQAYVCLPDHVAGCGYVTAPDPVSPVAERLPRTPFT